MFRSMPMKVRQIDALSGGTNNNGNDDDDEDRGNRCMSTNPMTTTTSTTMTTTSTTTDDGCSATASSSSETATSPTQHAPQHRGRTKRTNPMPTRIARKKKVPSKMRRSFVRSQSFHSASSFRSSHHHHPHPHRRRRRCHHHDQESSKHLRRRQSSSSSLALARWKDPILPTIPTFYPLERTNCLLLTRMGHSLPVVCDRIHECLRILSVHATYHDCPCASASLVTMENVELRLRLWNAPSVKGEEAIQLEVQRVQGDTIAFHRYSGLILRAARGEFRSDGGNDEHEHEQNDRHGFVPRSRVRPSSPHGSNNIHNDDNNTHNNMRDILQSQHVLSMTTTGEDANQEALKAIEIASDLIAKDRLDARLLGLENLTLLTNPTKSTREACTMASKFVLLGSRWDEAVGGDSSLDGVCSDGRHAMEKIRRALFQIVQGRSLANDDIIPNADVMMDDDHDSDDDSDHDGYDSMDDDDDDDGDDDDDDDTTVGCNDVPARRSSRHSIGCVDTAVNLALTVISNAWDNVLRFGLWLSDDRQSDGSGHGTKGDVLAKKTAVEEFLMAACAENNNNKNDDDDDDDPNTTNGDFVSTLIGYVRDAKRSPHNATLAVKTLRILCELSPDLTQTRAWTYHGANRSVLDALKIGASRHNLLQKECLEFQALAAAGA